MNLGMSLTFIPSQIPREVQTLLFSATFPDNVRIFAAKFAPNANEIALKREELFVDGIKQFYLDCKGESHKYEVLVELYGLLTIGQSMIFCKVNTIHLVYVAYIYYISVGKRQIELRHVW